MSDHDDYDTMDDTPIPRRGPSAAALMLPIVTALVAALAGMAAGALVIALWWRATPPVEKEIVKLRDLTDDEIDGMCKPFLTDTLAELSEAQTKVTSLESEVEVKQARVTELEEAMKRGAVAGKALRAELAAAKKELEEVKAQLAVAIEEKEQALVKLEETVEQLRATEDELSLVSRM